MYNSNIDIDKVVDDNLPSRKKKLNLISFLNVLLKPFKIIYDWYLEAKAKYIYLVAFNGQKDMLERILNDTFDNISRDIYITQRGLIDVNYSFYTVESRVDHYGYYKWNSATVYNVGDKIYYLGKIYISLTSGDSNKTPTGLAPYWAEYALPTYKRYKSEYDLSGGFIINIPTALVFDEVYLRSLVNFYKLAGRPYEIVLY
jgi:hypothetical protein